MSEACISETQKMFLLDLLDLTEVVGPRGLEAKCNEALGPDNCNLDDEIFGKNVADARAQIEAMPICEKPEAAPSEAA